MKIGQHLANMVYIGWRINLPAHSLWRQKWRIRFDEQSVLRDSFRNFAQVLGENGQIPVLLAVWAPPLAAIGLSLGLLLHLEDG